MRIDPAREVAARVLGTRHIAVINQVAVRQQHGIRSLVGTQRHAVHGHHVGPVQEISDAPKTLRFTLGEERIVTDVQAHQLGVLQRSTGGENFEIERALGRQVVKHQLACVDLERRATAVNQHARQVQLLAV